MVASRQSAGLRGDALADAGNTDDAGAGRNGQEVPPRLVDGRVVFGRSFLWRAMYAVSLGHGFIPFT